jgi:membrane-associated phospholipid phosphatase
MNLKKSGPIVRGDLNLKHRKEVVASLLIWCCFASQFIFGFPADEDEVKKVGQAEPTPAAKKETYLSRFIKDDVQMWTTPFNLDLKGSLLFAAAVIGTGVLIANDEAIYRGFKNFQAGKPWLEQVGSAGTFIGDWGVDCGIAGLFVIGGLAFKDEKARETGLMALDTLLHTGLLAQVVKHLAGRQRPSAEGGQDYWFGPGAMFNRYREDAFARYDSFLSGHTITAWGLATVIAENYKGTFWVPAACYGLATVVGLTRVTEDTHWLSDVFAGAVLGYVIGRMVVRNRDRRLQVVPTVSGDSLALSLTYRFE